MALISAFALIFMCWNATALTLPKDLTSSDRRQMLNTLGTSLGIKNLSNPYPLGGHSGVEIGVSLELIDTSGLSTLGAQTERQPELAVSRLSLGKGLYNNVDVFVQWIPYSGSTQMSDFGGLLRWKFFESEELPIHFSLLTYANQSNFSDSFLSFSMGADLMVAMTASDFSVFFGFGVVEAEGQFRARGNTAIINPSDPALAAGAEVLKQKRRDGHSFFGLSYNLSRFFLALQMDRYGDTVYSAKIGTRF